MGEIIMFLIKIDVLTSFYFNYLRLVRSTYLFGTTPPFQMVINDVPIHTPLHNSAIFRPSPHQSLEFQILLYQQYIRATQYSR